MVAISGFLSGIFVVTANAWMNAPAGFTFADGQFSAIDPIAAMLNEASLHEVLHMTLAAFVATGFAVAAVHAFSLRRNPGSIFHRRALGLALVVGGISIPLQIASGDLSARAVARLQPVKLAAMEAHYQTQTGAPPLIGGMPDDATQTTRYALPIPRGLKTRARRTRRCACSSSPWEWALWCCCRHCSSCSACSKATNVVAQAGCPRGESVEQVSQHADRAMTVIHALPGTVAVFSHGHLLRALAVRWLGLPLGVGRHLALDTGANSILGYEHPDQEAPVISLWNECSS